MEETLIPTSKLIGILESNTCCLSDIYTAFKLLLDGFAEEPDILELIRDRSFTNVTKTL
jgi:hypothetical protein